MRPPECAICNSDFDCSDEGGLIYFAKRPSDVAWHKQMEEKGFVGHPPEAEWFCKRHFKAAKKLEHLTIDVAFVALNDMK
jgi:hypothetical protein